MSLDYLLAGFSFVGSLGFLSALLYSLRNTHITKYASSTWFTFCVGMLFACLWSLTSGLSYIGPYKPEFHAASNIFLACFASFLLAAAYISYTTDIKLM